MNVFKKIGIAIVGAFIGMLMAVSGGCSHKTCPLVADSVPAVTVAVPAVQYPVIPVVDADGNVTAEIVDNGVIVTPAR